MLKNILKHLAKEIRKQKNKETREKSKDKIEINKMDKDHKKLIKNWFFVKISISLTKLNKKKQNRCT